MARNEIVLDIKTDGASEAVSDLNKVEKAQSGIETQGQKNKKTTDEQIKGTKVFADVLDNFGVTGANAMFGLGEGLSEVAGGFKATGVAIAASGLGALLVLLPQIAEAFSHVSKVVDRLTGGMDRYNDTLMDGNLAAQDQLVTLNAYTDVLFDVNQSEEARLGALRKLNELGVDTEGVTLDNVEANKQLRDSIDAVTESILKQARADAIRERLTEVAKERLELERQIAEEGLTFQEVLLGSQASAIVNAVELNALKKEENELAALLAGNTATVLETEQERINLEKEREDFRAGAAERELRRLEALKQANAGLAEVESLSSRLEVDQAIANLQAVEQIERDKIDIKRTSSDALEDLLNADIEGEQFYVESVSALTSLLGDESKRAFQVNKGVQIAETLISTYAAAQKAYNSQLTIPSPDAPVRAAVAAGVSIAKGLARVASIASVKFDGSGGGGASGGAAAGVSGGGGAQVLTPGNLVPDIPTADQTPIQTYVVEQDITDSQSMAREIRRRATL